jgi:23S rRNA pseudouridine2604 synthase
MCEAFGFTVEALQRVRIMRIHLGELPLGRWRNLTTEEIATLLPPRTRAPQAAARPAPPPRRGPQAPRPSQGRSRQRGRGRG